MYLYKNEWQLGVLAMSVHSCDAPVAVSALNS